MSGLKGWLACIVLAAALPTAATAQKAPPVPTGVNGSVLGAAEQFRIEGPARVCMNESGFDLAAGETSYLAYLGIHLARIVIRGRFGDVQIAEGENFPQPRAHGVPVKLAGLNIRRYGRRYAVYVWSELYGRDKILLWVSGLRGRESDLAVLRRIVPAARGPGCKRRFLFGWFFDEEEKAK